MSDDTNGVQHAAEQAAVADLRLVKLLGTPVQLWARSQEASDELLREFTLISIGDRPGEKDLPQRLTAIARELSAKYGNLGGEQRERLEIAAEQGQLVIDELSYDVPPDVGPVAVDIAKLLDEADQYCQKGGHLLSLASSPEVRALRWWMLEEFQRQIDGEAPTAWADSAWAQAADGADGGAGAAGADGTDGGDGTAGGGSS